MIIVKTKNGDRFINDKAVTMVEHERDKAEVTAYCDDGAYYKIEDVEDIIYTNDAQPTSWKDEGSEIQRLKATIEKKDKKFDQMLEHSRFMREWFFIYQNAFDEIKNKTRQSERENKCIYVNPVAIIDQAETKYQESLKRFEDAREKWDK